MRNIMKLAVPLLMIGGAVLMTSCSRYDRYYGNAGYGYGGSGAYADGVYDASGLPIFGYSGGRPVYAYNDYGSPIFSFSYIRSGHYVPSWGPASWYRGGYRYPSRIHRVSQLPHHGRNWRPPLFDSHRPSINNRPRPGHNRPPSNILVSRPGAYRPGHINNRPGHINNRPGHINNRPGHINNRPGHINNRPGHINNRPSLNRPGQRPGRPHASEPQRPQRPSYNVPRQRPSGAVRPQRPERLYGNHTRPAASEVRSNRKPPVYGNTRVPSASHL